MGKQHQTIPGEPEEAPVPPSRPEIEPPRDPQVPGVPEEAPDRQPEELPPNEIPAPAVDPSKSYKLE